MSRSRYMVRMTYADGSPGLGFHPTRTAAMVAAQSPTHGGRRVAVAEVCERLSSGAEVPIRTYLPAHPEEVRPMTRRLKDRGDNGLYPLGDYAPGFHDIPQHLLRAEPTGEYRPPRAGEWYLSGAPVAAYRVLGDLSTSYDIARIVRVEIVPATVRKCADPYISGAALARNDALWTKAEEDED